MNSYKVVPEWNEEMTLEVVSDNASVQLKSGEVVRIEPAHGHQNLFRVHLGDVVREALIKTSTRGIVEISWQGYTYSLKVSDASYDRFAAVLRESMVAVQQKIKVQAPMPGLLKQIVVHNGQSVRKGEKLFILEAMKMENIIKAPATGTIQSLEFQEGSAVEKGSLLCIVEPPTQTADA